MSQATFDQTNNQGSSSQPVNPAPRKADALVRAGSPDPAPDAPGHPFNPERREGVSSPSPASGPKTEAGKSRSSRNALPHGLRAKKIENAVPSALRSEYEKLRQQYLDDYDPPGAIESTLVDMVIFALATLKSPRNGNSSPTSTGRNGFVMVAGEKLSRYRGSHERLLFRSLNQLRQITAGTSPPRDRPRKPPSPPYLAPGVEQKPSETTSTPPTTHPKPKPPAATRIQANRECKGSGSVSATHVIQKTVPPS